MIKITFEMFRDHEMVSGLLKIQPDCEKRADKQQGVGHLPKHKSKRLTTCPKRLTA